MLKKSGIAKKIKLQQSHYSFPQELYYMLQMYKGELQNKIKYSEYKLAPSCMGINAYIYSWRFKPRFTAECEIRDCRIPNINKNFQFKYCVLNIFYTNAYNRSVRVYTEENSKIIRNIYIRMNEIFTEQQH